MARIRYIKPEFYSDTTISEISIQARYLYIGLFCQLDCNGLTIDDPKFLKREIYPYDEEITSKRVQELIDELEDNGRLVRFPYEGKDYLYCPTLSKHQKFHKDERPRYSIPLDTVLAPYQQGATPMPAPNRSELTQALTALVTGNGELVTETGTETGTRLAQGSSNPDAEKEEKSPIAVKEPINPEGPSPTALTWRAYKSAYKDRWGDDPPWNAKTAGMLKQMISRIPADESPAVAAFYLTHNDSFYVKSMHPVGLLLRDVEKIRTEWATGRKMTGAQAKQSEQRDANVEAMKSYLAKKGMPLG